MASSPVLTGHCGCEGVQFEIDAPLVAAGYCHCTRCQRRTGGGASATARVAPGSLCVVAGEELLASWDPPDGFSKIFCSACGSALFGSAPGTDEISLVRMGVIDGDPGMRMMGRQFVAYAAPWEPIPEDGLPRFNESFPEPA